jgi:predicted enzyme related to lactoylglutathione lyase
VPKRAAAPIGAPCWIELFTSDPDRSRTFYHQYTTLGEGDGALAGVMDASGFLPEGVPSKWYVYVAVADTDAALERVVELGGAVVMPAEDTPYGRLAEVTDPTGAAFKLVAGG